jgi:hypothetical protein
MPTTAASAGTTTGPNPGPARTVIVLSDWNGSWRPKVNCFWRRFGATTLRDDAAVLWRTGVVTAASSAGERPGRKRAALLAPIAPLCEEFTAMPRPDQYQPGVRGCRTKGGSDKQKPVRWNRNGALQRMRRATAHGEENAGSVGFLAPGRLRDYVEPGPRQQSARPPGSLRKAPTPGSRGRKGDGGCVRNTTKRTGCARSRRERRRISQTPSGRTQRKAPGCGCPGNAPPATRLLDVAICDGVSACTG